MRLSHLPSLSAMLVAVLLGGCNSGPVALVAVRGRVFSRGVPLPTGVIVFTPDSGHGCHGPLACGLVQHDGRYELRTEERTGAAAGWYRVTVAAVETAGPSRPGQALVIPRSLLPEKYRNPELSGLVREVKADQENTIDFDLE